MAQQFAKMDAFLDGNPKVRKAGRNGRDVFLFVLRRIAVLDAEGSVPVANVETWFLADQLMISETEASEGLERAIAARLLSVDGDLVHVTGWDTAWGKRAMTEAERKAAERARNKLANGTVTMPPVTISHDGTVTPSRPESDGPDCHALDKIREEKKRTQSRAARSCVLPLEWAPSQALREKATAQGVDPDRLAEEMRDWSASKGERRVDWDATFRTFLRRAGTTGQSRKVIPIEQPRQIQRLA